MKRADSDKGSALFYACYACAGNRPNLHNGKLKHLWRSSMDSALNSAGTPFPALHGPAPQKTRCHKKRTEEIPCYWISSVGGMDETRTRDLLRDRQAF